jgi:hypothetical protein
MFKPIIKSTWLYLQYLVVFTQQDELYRIIYLFQVNSTCFGRSFAHHQEHLTVFTASASVHPSCYRLAAGNRQQLG